MSVSLKSTLGRRLADTSGFSVVEILIVFTIIGIAMIPMAAIQFSSRREVTQADRMSVAAERAMSRIELAKLAGFAFAGGDTLFEDPYTVITTVVPDSTNPFLRELSVEVSWDTAAGRRNVVVGTKQSDR